MKISSSKHNNNYSSTKYCKYINRTIKNIYTTIGQYTIGMIDFNSYKNRFRLDIIDMETDSDVYKKSVSIYSNRIYISKILSSRLHGFVEKKQNLSKRLT